MRFTQVIPILRMFDVAKARAHYVDWLGFAVDWESRFDDDAPLYMQIGRDGLTLHLSEHYGDATPGATVFLWVEDLDALHAEISGRRYPYARPALSPAPWGGRMMEIPDPFGNRLRCAART